MDFLFVFICLVFILIGIFKSHNKNRSAAFVIMMLSLFNAIALSYAKRGEGASSFGYLGIMVIKMSDVGQMVRISLGIKSRLMAIIHKVILRRMEYAHHHIMRFYKVQETI